MQTQLDLFACCKLTATKTHCVSYTRIVTREKVMAIIINQNINLRFSCMCRIDCIILASV